MYLRKPFARAIKQARRALTFALSALLLAAAPAWADDPPPLVAGPVISGPIGQPIQTELLASERGLNIGFTDLSGLTPTYIAVENGQPVAHSIIVTAPGDTVGYQQALPSGVARYGADGGATAYLPPPVLSDGQLFTNTFSYRVVETNTVQTVSLGGGVTAIIRAGGIDRATATAASAADAQSQALGQLGTLNLPGRRLPAIVTASGLVENVTETRASAITARDTYQTLTVAFGPQAIIVGNRGVCDQPFGTCQGGVTTVVPDGVEGFDTYTMQDVYVANTITRTITSSGEVILDIPFAAYGRVHPAAQTMALEQSGTFLTRALHGADARLAAPLGDARRRWSVFLEGVHQSSDFDAKGAVAASDGDFSGARGGVSFAAAPNLTLGAIGETGSWSWGLHDAVLPERADDAQTWRLGGFASWRPQSWRISLAGFGGQARVKSIASSTLGGGTSTARYDADVYGAGAEIGYAIPVHGLTVTPNIGLDWLGWRAPAFAESGGLAPLSVQSASRDQTRLHLGVGIDYEAARWAVGGYIRGTYVDGDRTGLIIASDGVSQPGSFAIEGPASDRRQAEIGAHIDYAPRPDIVLSLSGAARGGEQSQSYGVQLGVHIAL